MKKECRIENEECRIFLNSQFSILNSCLPFVCTAAVLTVIQAPIDLSVLAWVAWVPFIVVCSPEAKPCRLFVVGYVTCLLYWMGNLYWVAPVTIAGWLVFCVYTAFLWPVLALCLRFCRRKKVPLFLASAVLIVGIERMQGFFLGGFFWRFLAHSQYQNTTIIQIADIFGAGGVSFLIAMVNGLIAELVLDARLNPKSEKRNSKQIRNSNAPMTKKLSHNGESRFGHLNFCHSILFRISYFVLRAFKPTNLLKMSLVSAVVVAAVLYGRWRIHQAEECITAGPVVASLQSNVPQSVKRTFESGQELFDGLMQKSETAVQAGAELIVWPETMVQAMLDTEVWPWLASSEGHKALDKALREHAKGNAYLLVGAYGSEVRQEGDELYQARYNSAFFYRPDGTQDPKRYDKIHLVPFGEVLPLRKSMSWFYELLMKIKFIPYNFDYSLDYGTNYTVFEMAGEDSNEPKPAYKFGVIICYEGTVPYIARKFALDENDHKRIDWLVNISNDGWFVRFKNDKVQPSMELPQHAAVCAFRAVENRLAVVRSVNTGISCLIDSLGRIRDGYAEGTLPDKAMARTGMAGWFMDRVPVDARVTFFSKHGEWLDFCCESCVILLIIVLLVRSAKLKGRHILRHGSGHALARRSHGK
ncbi:MAG: apolipoprotein N-acyltransferase [Planctomycetes bacterium RBG_16_55_9]|nr:MAG: apolipoprotein N-acyltransferase [Planctomycetes bacterium RBG_16_55_9]